MYLYIVGRPHSGSTILDILLGNSPTVAGIGQLVSGMPKPQGRCACGELISACAFWRAVRAEVERSGLGWDEAVAASVGQAHVKAFWRTWRAPPDDPAMQRLKEITCSVARAIAHVAGKPHVLDSSKEPTRALFLAKCCPEARFIRLVRDPRSSVESHYWRIKSWGFHHFLRKDRHHPRLLPLFVLLAAASWTVGNILGEIAMRHARGRVVVVRYEDLRDDPAGVLERIGDALALDLSGVVGRVGRGEILDTGHVIGGNGIRHEAGLRFDAGKEKTRPRLPLWARTATLLLCWPMMGRYGYRLQSPQAPSGRLTAVGSSTPTAARRPAGG
jgi:hypothetical protein